MTIGSRPAARATTAARRARRLDHAASHPVGLRLVAVARQPARLVRRRQRPRRLRGRARRGTAWRGCGSCTATWPFFATRARHRRAEPRQGRHAGRPPICRAGARRRVAARSGAGSADEFELTRDSILRVNQRARMLDAMPVLQRSIELRNPYVDSLSELQVRLLARLRALPAGRRRDVRT